MIGHKLTVVGDGVVADVRIKIAEYFEGFLEAFDTSREKITPLLTLALRIPAIDKMNHLSHIGVIPATEGDAWDKILIVDQSKSSRCEKTAVVVAKVVQADTQLLGFILRQVQVQI